MSAELTLPQLPNTSVVTIARWLKKAGEQIVAREKLLEAYSDHFDWDIPAPCDGTLQEIRAPEGARVKVGETIATIATVNDQANSQLPTSKSQPSSTRVSPIAAKIAAEHNINLAQVQGGGAGGRVTKEDVISFIESRNQPTNDQTTQQANHRTTKPPARLTQDTLIELSTAQRARRAGLAQHKRDSTRYDIRRN